MSPQIVSLATDREKYLNIAKTEREAEIQPNRVADDFRWEAKAFVARSSGACFHEVMLAHCSVMYQVDNTLNGVTIQTLFTSFTRDYN
jgi:hypothetical protein